MYRYKIYTLVNIKDLELVFDNICCDGLGYSFTNVSCCGIGSHNAFGCGRPNVHSKLCEYQRSYLFFDGRHNSEKAQEQFAHLLFGANPNVIQPMNIRELITYPVNTNMSEFWKEPVGRNLLLVHEYDVNASVST